MACAARQDCYNAGGSTEKHKANSLLFFVPGGKRFLRDMRFGSDQSRAASIPRFR